MNTQRAGLIPLTLIALTTLGAADCEPASTCAIGDGGRFESVDLLECGLGPNGVVTCHWSLDLNANGTFSWMYSDVGESGKWTCEGDQITGTSSTTYQGSWDEATGLLTWDGVAYRPM